MKRPKLFIILPNLYMGGAERVAITLLTYIDRKKFDLHLVIVGSKDGALYAEIPKDIKVTALNRASVKFGIFALLALLRTNRPDIVFSTLSHLNLALAICRFLLPANTKIVVRESNIVSENVKLFPLSMLFNFLYRRCYCKLDLIISQTIEMAEDLKRNYNVPDKKIVLMNNPVDRDDLYKKAAVKKIQRSQKRVIVACGRLDYQKGFDILLDALGILQQKEIEAWLVGDGQLRDTLEEQARQLGISGQIKFLGFQQNPYPYILNAEIYVLSSRFEGMPNVVLEALALGKLVVATPAPGGVVELLEKSKDCVIAKQITAESLAQALITYFSKQTPIVPEEKLIYPYLAKNVVGQFEEFLEHTLK